MALAVFLNASHEAEESMRQGLPEADRPSIQIQLLGDSTQARAEALVPEMVVLPPGTYRMGCLSNDSDCGYDETPVRLITIAASFALGKYEVTYDEWGACVADGGCGGYNPAGFVASWGRGSRPVLVSWEDAQRYTVWLSEKTRLRYRLPSEAEWEYAARAGSETKYHFGDNAARLSSWGNGLDLSGWREFGRRGESVLACDDKHAFAAPVGVFPANSFGLYDMHGNVSEWVEDCWSERYSDADGAAPWLRGRCDFRVSRGGSWTNDARDLRSANRSRARPDTRSFVIGFRVALSLD